MIPTRDESMAQLERMLASDVFAGSTRLSRFLRYVAEQSLAGESQRLKEYTIGVEVFDRDQHYDPRVDSIVRVEAGRLRTKLEQYYQGPGRDDAIVIRLQKGGYVPAFEARGALALRAQEDGAPLRDGASRLFHERSSAAVPVPSSSSPARSQPMRSRRIAGLAALAVVSLLAIATVVALSRGWFSTPPPPNSVAVLPFETHSNAAESRTIAAQLTQIVTADLVRAERFSVVPSRNARELGAGGTAQSVSRRLGASWLLEARVTHEGDSLRVQALIMNPERNRKLWVETFTGDAARLDELAHRIGTSAATALQANGASARP
jgi:adenylate cyclase